MGNCFRHEGRKVGSADMKASPRDPRSTRILAKSIVRDLRQQGWDSGSLLALATELLGLIAADARARRVEAQRPTR
jgi:hypothetical protein